MRNSDASASAASTWAGQCQCVKYVDVEKGDLGKVRGAGVFDLTDVFEHGDPVFVVEWRVAGRHLKDQHSTSPPDTPQQPVYMSPSIFTADQHP